MHTKEITDLRGEIFKITPENRFYIANLLLDEADGFKILDNGNWSLWDRELIRVDKSPTVYFYNGKFWNRPQKTDFPSGGITYHERNKGMLDSIGERLKAANTTKQAERIAQLEKQLSIKSLEVENLEIRLNRAMNEIGRLTIE